MKIQSIDSNFSYEPKIDRPDLHFRSVLEAPFSLHGLMREDGHFCRMPQKIADTVNDGVAALNTCTAGGRLRFVTDSPYVAVMVKYNTMCKMQHFAYSGSFGLDLYYSTRCDAPAGEGDIYAGTFLPDGESELFEGAVDLPRGIGKCTVTIHLPLYGGIDELFIGTKEGCVLLPAAPYRVKTPVVFYGSSITQGGCASRPGNAYDNILSRLVSCDHVNLGFSGSALGEESMANYLAGLEMSAFILDYDHNAPTPAHLAATHEPLFRAVRKTHPDLPILMLSRPLFHLDEDCRERVEIIRRTCENAQRAGDRHVAFLPGPELIEERVRETATVDNCHPNDSGFVSMAYAVLPWLREVL